jgi:hypothetical protein
VSAGVDPALEGFLPGVALGTVARDRQELPLEALQGRETARALVAIGTIVLHEVGTSTH